MKYYKRLKKYKASNLTLDVETLEGYSYNWYKICSKFKSPSGEIVIVNNYNYSISTAKHWHKIMGALNELSVGYFTIEAPLGLQDLEAAQWHYENKIEQKNEYMNRPRVQQKTKERLSEEIAQLKLELELIMELQKHETV